MASEVEQVLGAGVPAVKPLSKARAQKITDQIRAAGASIPVLLLEAFEGRAYEVLTGEDGEPYGTWSAYVTAEFGMSPENARKAVVQAHFARSAAAIVGGPVEVSARQVQALSANTKGHLDVVLDQLRQVVESKPEDERPDAIAGVLTPPKRARLTTGASGPSTEVVRRVMIPTWLDEVWPDMKRAAAAEGLEPTVLAVQVLRNWLGTIVLPVEPEPAQAPEKPKRTSRPRQSKPDAQEGDRDGAQDEGAAPEAEQPEVVADDAQGTAGPTPYNPFG